MNFNNSKKNVFIGITFDRIGEIDTMNEKFVADITIESFWEDENVIGKYNESTDWNPNLLIDNILSENRKTTKYKVERIDERNTTKVTQIQSIKGSFWERLELQNFPLDIQELSITVSSTRSTEEISIEEDKSKRYFNSRVGKTFVDQQKWKFYSYVEISNKESVEEDESLKSYKCGDDMPLIRAACFVARQPGYYYWNAYFLIFLITVSSLCTFSVDCRLPQSRLQITFTLLLTSISFKWVVNRSLPAISYLTSLDIYAIANIVFLCLIGSWHAIAGACWEASYARFLDMWLLISFASLFVLIQIVLILKLTIPYIKICDLKRKEKKYLKNNNTQF